MSTEKEKSRAGLLYDANNDTELIRERDVAKIACYAYNQLSPGEKIARQELLKKHLGKTGNNFLIEQPFYFDYGYNIFIGENFYANVNCVILDGATVTFGDNVFIAPNCSFYSAGHPLDVENRNKGLEYAYPITIGNNVWIGGNVSVLPGVNIGDNSVIGAGSIVNKDIPANVLAAGNPCRVIRSLDTINNPSQI